MKRETMIWAAIMLLGAGTLIWRAAFTTNGMGREYVRAVPVGNGQWNRYDPATYDDYIRSESANPNQREYLLSIPRTICLWIAAFFTIAIFSFLYRDNPIYKIVEAIYVGLSAGYWMVIAFWDVLIPNLLGKVWPTMIQKWAMPGLSGPDAKRDFWYLIPLVLGIMLLWRMAPRGDWIARWPLAFIIGTTAGLQLVAYLHGDFLEQIRSSILPLVVNNLGAFDFWASVENLIVVVGVLSCLTYFFFSFEHTGFVGKTANVGIWFLMITFGASFGYTVMGRIALLAIRIEFLLDDWLWLIDPLHRHTR
jgi:hypothetical protein